MVNWRTTCAGWALAALLASAFASGDAGALDATEEMLHRARLGQAPTERDRRLARELLAEWRDSEEVAPEAGDPGIGRALEAIAEGRRLGAAEQAATVRMGERYLRGRDGPDGRGAGPPQANPVGVTRSTGRRWLAGRPTAVVALVGTGVVAAGVGWIIASRRFRRR
jgi:hypothetical protein